VTYSFIQDVPADAAIYRKIKALLPIDPPAGMVAHLVVQREQGLRYIDVWDTEASWRHFQDEHVEPAVGKVLAEYGIPHDHSLVSVEEINVIDAWLGDGPAAAG
jgi:hypothetical protein